MRRSDPSEDSQEYSHMRGIKMDGLHNSQVTVRAIAVTIGDQEERTVTGQAIQNFTIKATLPQQAEDQFNLVGESITAGLHTADQTEQWVPVAWSKVGRAEDLRHVAMMLTQWNAPMESDAAKEKRNEAKLVSLRE